MMKRDDPNINGDNTTLFRHWMHAGQVVGFDIISIDRGAEDFIAMSVVIA